MSNGYILLWRKSLDSSVWADAKLWRVWSWCLLRASWKERTVLLGRCPVQLSPGDLATTLAEISAGTGFSQKEVRSCLALGKKSGCMEVRGTARGTLIRLVNWQDYQRPGPDPDLPAGTPAGKAGARPRARSGRTTGTPFLDGGKKGTRKDAQDAAQQACVEPSALRAGDCERFLAAYPKRTAQAAARAAWARLDAELPGGLPPLDELLAAVDRQARTPAWGREDGRYIPSPANWLLGQRWQDAPAAALPAPGNAALPAPGDVALPAPCEHCNSTGILHARRRDGVGAGYAFRCGHCRQNPCQSLPQATRDELHGLGFSLCD
jgi:hypothetical protein